MRLNNIMSAWFVIGRLGLMSHSLVSPPRLHIHTLHALLEFSLPRIFTSTLYLNFQSHFIQVGYWGKVYSSFHNMELLNNSTATLLLWSNAGIDGVSGNYVRLIFEISSNLSIKVISGAGQFHASFFLWFTVPAPGSIGQGHLSLQFFPLIHGATRPVSWAKTTFYLCQCQVPKAKVTSLVLAPCLVPFSSLLGFLPLAHGACARIHRQ